MVKSVHDYFRPGAEFFSYELGIQGKKDFDELTDTGENFQKWTRVFSTRC